MVQTLATRTRTRPGATGRGLLALALCLALVSAYMPVPAAAAAEDEVAVSLPTPPKQPRTPLENPQLPSAGGRDPLTPPNMQAPGAPVLMAGTPATYTVNSNMDTTDTNTGDGACLDALGKCSLRAAVQQANAHAGDDTIFLPAGTYTLNIGGGDEQAAATGDLDILENLTIIGSGGNAEGAASATVIDGSAIDRVFSVNPYPWDKLVNATFKALTIQNGKPVGTADMGTGGGIDFTGDNGTSTPGQGGQLYVYNCVIKNNQTVGISAAGAGIFMINTNNLAGTASATIEKSTITGNIAGDWHGGGIMNSGMTLTILDSTISGNHARSTMTGSVRLGGGLHSNNNGTTTIRRSTFSNNTAEGDFGQGGAIYAQSATLIVESSTISGNEAGKQGGGIGVTTSTTLTNVTITQNYTGTNASATAVTGGGIYTNNASVAKLRNTIVHDNFIGKPNDATPDTPNEVGGSALDTANSYNNILSSNGTGGLTNGANGNKIGVNPLLSALGNYGGRTQTHKLLTGSPAIEAGSDSFYTAGDKDQRGLERKMDSADSDATSHVDIGAVEAYPTISDISNQTSPATVALPVPFYIGDATQGVTIAAASSNQSVVPNGNLVVTNGNTFNPTLTVTGAAVGTATITVTVSAGGQTETDTFVMTVTTPPKASLPTVTPTTTNEDTQSSTGLVVTPDAADTTVSHFKITAITNGKLYKSNGTTEITNGSFITKAEGAAGLKFTPAADFNGAASFLVQAAYDSAGTGLSDAATATISVTAVNDPPVGGADLLSPVSEDAAQFSIPFTTLKANDSPGPADESSQTLEITGVTAGTGGSVSISGSNVLFTPAANFSGTATFTYTLQDSGAAPNTSSVTVSIPVTPVADTPSVTPATTLEDTQSTSGLVISRNAADGAEVTHFRITGTTGGKLYQHDGTTEIADGSYITYAQGNAGLKFTPAANLNSPDGTFGFTVSAATDSAGTGISGTASASITVNAVNDPPTGVNDTLADAAEDSGPWTIPFATLTGNDSKGPADEASQNLTVSAVSNPTGGTVATSGTDVIFTPDADFNGTASFTYTVQDDGAAPNTATAAASFTVTPVNDAPVGVNDTLSAVDEDSAAQTIPFGLLIANDSAGPADEIGQLLTITAVSNPTGGTVAISGNNVIFTLAPNFQGTAGFTYTVADNGTTNGAPDPKTATATVTFPVNGMAEAPFVTPAVTAEDSQTTAGLVITPDAADGGSVTHYYITGITGGGLYKHDGTTQISNGDYITAAEGAAGLKFTPVANLNTPAGGTFGFTVQAALDGAGTGMGPGANGIIVVNEVNDAPAGTDDTVADIAEDSAAVTIAAATLLANDSKGPANESTQTLSITAADNAVGGTVSVVNGDVVFTPAANYTGAASFRYTLTDNGTTAGAADPKSSTATVTFTVTPTPDAPQITSATTAEDTQSTSGLVVTPNALDGAEISHFVITVITGGRLYKQDGTELFVGSLITTAEGAAGLKFTPAADANGTNFSISLAARDSGRGLTGPEATATITVTEVNDAPTGVADMPAVVAEDAAPVTFAAATLTANDLAGPANENSQTLTVTAVTALTGGTVSLDAGTQTITFTPEADFYGTATFTYTVRDNGTTNGAPDPKTGTATVSIPVSPAADRPSVTPTVTAEETQSTTGLIITRSPVDGPEVTHFEITGITGGKLYLHDGTTEVADGTFITAAQAGAGLKFTPAADANSLAGDTFTFTVKAALDGSGAEISSGAVAQITVTEVNDRPTGVNDTLADAAEDSGPWTIPFATLTANDSTGPADESGQALTVTSVGAAVGGTVAISGSNVIFTPLTDYTGAANFTYVVADNGTTDGAADPKTAAAPAMAIFTVTSVNDAPIGTDDLLTAVEEDSAPRTIPFADLLANDKNGPDTAFDESIQSLTIINVGAATGGTAAIVGNEIIFTLNPNFNGTAGFTYTLQDNGVTNLTVDPQTDTATVSFTVTPAAEPPVVTPATTPEETQSTSGLVITRDAADGAEVTVFKITAITGGQLYLADGSTALSDGDWITVAQGGNGLKFTPAPESNSPAGAAFGFTVQAALNTAGDGISGGTPVAITVTEVNDTPTGADDNLAPIAEDSAAVTIAAATLLANDSPGPANESGQTLSIAAADNAVGGTVTVVGGDVLFTPAADFYGTASFRYTLTDNGTTGGAADPLTSTATATFAVTPMPDVAQITPATTAEDTQSTAGLVVTPNAADGAEITHFVVTGITGGRLFHSDGTTQIQANDQITVAEGAAGLKFSPDADLNGQNAGAGFFTITVKAYDSLRDRIGPVATGTITVTEVNDTPVGVADPLANVAEDSGPRTIPFAALTGNDQVGPNESVQTLTVTAVSDVVGGAASIVGQAVIFTPDADYNGPASFTYTLTDDGTTGGTADPKSSTAVASFTVTEVNDAPVGTADKLADVAEDSGPWTIPFASLLGNDATGPANEGAQSLTVVGVSGAVGGTAAITGTDVIFTPTLNFNGTASFTYTLQDDGTTAGAADPLTATATVSFTVTPVNDAPVAQDKVLTAVVGANIKGTVTATDVDGDTLTYAVVDAPTRGQVTMKTDGSYVYRASRMGKDTFTFRANDGTDDSNLATVTITIDAAPVETILTISVPVTETRESSILVSGTTNPDAYVAVNGTTVHADAKGNWSTTVSLVEGPNTITASVGSLSRSVTVVRDTTPPELKLTASETRTEAETVLLTATSEPGAWILIEGQETSTLTVALKMGMNRFTATATDRLGNQSTATVSVIRVGNVPQTKYTDIGDHWAQGTIERLEGLKVVSIYPEPLFQPEARVTRLEFAVMVTRVLGLAPVNEAPAFTDTAAMPAWALPEVAAAVKAGIIKGMPDGSFAPNNLVTRAEMAIMLTRALTYAGKDTTPGEKHFADESQIPAWALAQVLTAARYGLITGYPDNTFQPANTTTRAEAVTMLARLLDATAK